MLFRSQEQQAEAQRNWEEKKQERKRIKTKGYRQRERTDRKKWYKKWDKTMEKKETIETMVKQAQANLQKTMAEIFTEKTRGQVNAVTINDITSQINTRAEQMAQQWRRIKIEGGNYQLNRDKFEIEADKMYQQLELEKWKDYIL